ncbi:MAG TPA: hypothetical protein PKY30_23825 [Myxococcota bacterium]|nr:hypothetical protein [Myxococcota bacterium]HNH50088.1 hypothetical protein [Myxococcota bacterium]
MNPILCYIALIWSVLSLLSFGVTFYGYTEIGKTNAALVELGRELPPDSDAHYGVWLRGLINTKLALVAHRRQLVRYTVRAFLLAWMCLVGAGLLALVVSLNLMADR